MFIWIMVAIMGLILSFWGIIALFRKYRNCQVSGRYFGAVIVGFVIFAVYAFLSSIRPEFTDGRVTIAILLPVAIAILIVIREYQKGPP